MCASHSYASYDLGGRSGSKRLYWTHLKGLVDGNGSFLKAKKFTSIQKLLYWNFSRKNTDFLHFFTGDATKIANFKMQWLLNGNEFIGSVSFKEIF